MLFRLVTSEYDPQTERGYVEFRAGDDDGGEIIVTSILTFRSKSKLSISTTWVALPIQRR
jgi:hypothetical protein